MPLLLEVWPKTRWSTQGMRDILVEVIHVNYFSFSPASSLLVFLVDLNDLTLELIMGTAVTSGTLDAIRERMKSMQLAAAAGNLDSEPRSLMYVNDNQNQGLSGQLNRASENPLQSGVLPMDERALSGLQARMERLKSGTIEPL